MTTPSTLKGRVAQGLWAQGLFMGFEIGQRFLLVSLYLAVWPVELFGEWLVIQAAVMLLPFVDLGVMPYFSNALLMAWARGDAAAFDRLLRIGFGLYAALLALAIPIYALVVLLIAGAGGYADGAMSAATRGQVWLLLGLHQLVIIPHGLLTAIYRARTSFALDMYATMLKELALLVAVAAALLLGASPVQVAALHLAMGVLVYLPIVLDQRRRYPDLRHGLALPTRAEFRSFVGQLGWFTVLPLGDRLIGAGPILVLGAVASEAAVVVFATLRILAGIIRAGAEKISFLAGAEMAALYARGDRASLARLYLFTGRLAMGLAGFAGGLLYVVGEPFLALWTGGKVPYDEATLAALLAALILGSHGHVSFQLLRYTNRPREVVPLAAGRAALGLILGAALAARFGPAGMAAGLTASETLLLGLLLPLRLHRVDGLPFASFLARNLATALLSFGLSAAAAYALVELIGAWDVIRLAVVGALWSALMLGPALFLLLDGEQRAWLLGGLGRMLRRAAGPVSS